MDYYQILGIGRDVSAEEIKRAYRKSARSSHPDINKESNAEEKFKEINKAYEVLKDPEKRKLYDLYGERMEAYADSGSNAGGRSNHWYGGSSAGPEGFSHSFHFGGGGHDDSFELNEILKNLFERGGHAASQEEPAPQEAELEVSLGELHEGATRILSLQSYELEGQGGLRPVNKNLKVKIPRGLKDGSVIRLAGKGDGAADLLIRLKLVPDSRYTVKGYDLHSVVAVAPWEAALGAKIVVQTLDGDIRLTVPEGSQNGSILRLGGKGLLKRDKTRGDLLVSLDICLPKKLTEQEKNLFKELANQSTFDPRLEQQQKAAP